MKKLMKPKKTLLTVVIAASVSSVAHAGFTVNDLYLGFTQSSATSDYIIDLGQPGTVGAGGSTVVDLSGDFSLATFNSIFTGGANGVVMAVVAGNNDNTVNPFDVFATALRSGGAGTASVPGSNLSTKSHSSAAMSGGASQVASIMASTVNGLPTAGTSAVDSTKSYTSVVVTTGVQNNFIGKTGVNPTGTVGASGVIYEDLWGATTSSAYTYEGYFKFDSGAATLTFTPAAAVPEPTTYALFGCGLLCVLLRRRLSRKVA